MLIFIADSIYARIQPLSVVCFILFRYLMVYDTRYIVLPQFLRIVRYVLFSFLAGFSVRRFFEKRVSITALCRDWPFRIFYVVVGPRPYQIRQNSQSRGYVDHGTRKVSVLLTFWCSEISTVDSISTVRRIIISLKYTITSNVLDRCMCNLLKTLSFI